MSNDLVSTTLHPLITPAILQLLFWFALGIILQIVILFWQYKKNKLFNLTWPIGLLPHILLLYWYYFLVNFYPSSASPVFLLLMNILASLIVLLLLIFRFIAPNNLAVLMEQWCQAVLLIIVIMLFTLNQSVLLAINTNPITLLFSGIVLAQIFEQFFLFIIWQKQSHFTANLAFSNWKLLVILGLIESIFLLCNYYQHWLVETTVVIGWLLILPVLLNIYDRLIKKTSSRII